jgi:hypothetical protein
MSGGMKMLLETGIKLIKVKKRRRKKVKDKQIIF